MRYYYDFHIHSCLSPCGDNDMTPQNISAMAKLKGLNIIALTDHNSCLNCVAMEEAVKSRGLIFVPGMEVCTSEEVHVVCLFPDMATAMKFGEKIYRRIPDIRNRPHVFGYQFVVGENDDICAEETRLLTNALDLTIDRLEKAVAAAGGFSFPAHIDRPSFSIISNLGGIPDNCSFPVVEVRDPWGYPSLEERYPQLLTRSTVINSDAHNLADISERQHYLEADNLTCAADVIEALKRL